MPAKQILEIKTVSDGICIDTNIYICVSTSILVIYIDMQIQISISHSKKTWQK